MVIWNIIDLTINCTKVKHLWFSSVSARCSSIWQFSGSSSYAEKKLFKFRHVTGN
jgi:hypothetical protein